MKEILIKLREDNRYTQTAMAQLVGVSRQAYMKYETGDVEPPVEVIRKLKEIYHVSYDVLIDNRVDLVTSQKEEVVYHPSHDEVTLEVASPASAYGPSAGYLENTIQNTSLEEFANMLFSVAANLKTANLTLEEKLTKFEVYAKLAEAQMDIANGDKGDYSA